MKRDTAEKFLTKVAQFAAMRVDDVRLKDKAILLCLDMYFAGLRGKSNRFNNAEARELHARINRELEALESARDYNEPLPPENEYEQDYQGTVLRTEVVMCIMSGKSKGRMVTTLFSRGERVECFMFFVQILMMFVDVKKIIKCSGCGVFFFRSGGKKTVCGNTCRQRIRRAELTSEQKEKVRARDRLRYKRKIMKGEKK